MNSVYAKAGSRLKALPPSQKQVAKFVFVGVAAVLTDLGCYYVLLNLLPTHLAKGIDNEGLAKGISFLCGIAVTYNFNKFWTWKQRDRNHKRLVKFGVLYACSLLLNVGSNTGALYVLHKYKHLFDLPHKYLVAFVFATGISAVLNFLGQKFWVFASGQGAM